MTQLVDSKKENSKIDGILKTFGEWKHFTTLGEVPTELQIKNKSYNPTEREYLITMSTLYELLYGDDVRNPFINNDMTSNDRSKIIEYNITMLTLSELLYDDDVKTPFINDDMSSKDRRKIISDIREVIQSWELYSISYLRGMNEPRYVNGVPSPIVKKVMRSICDYNVDWNTNVSEIKVEKVKNPNKYRELSRQLSHHRINYLDLLPIEGFESDVN